MPLMGKKGEDGKFCGQVQYEIVNHETRRPVKFRNIDGLDSLGNRN